MLAKAKYFTFNSNYSQHKHPESNKYIKAFSHFRSLEIWILILLVKIIGKVIKGWWKMCAIDCKAMLKTRKEKIVFLERAVAAVPWTQLWINLFLILKPKQKRARPLKHSTRRKNEKEKLRQTLNIFLKPEVYKNCCVVFMFYKLFHHSPSSTFRLTTLFHEVIFLVCLGLVPEFIWPGPHY